MKKERRSIVVPHRVGYKYQLLVMMLAISVSSLWFGKQWGQDNLARVTTNHQQLVVKANKLQATLELTASELEMVRLNKQVDLAAIENTRQEMIQLQKQISEQEQQLGLYKELLGNEDHPMGLSITKFDITNIDQNRYSYRWVANQKAAQLETITVLADIFIIGTVNGEEETFMLSDLDDEIKAMPMSLSLKYFSINQGILSIPEGFIPAKVRFKLRYSWKKIANFDDIFPWAKKD
ncbi:MAG: hypothetical protein P8Q37_05315 [Porticoccaceae bacterium]|nr:hypothetical protein [Porticoccaceae bacterium]MDG1474303.1 hypothetical protein [Porticoccaceae bacterium]